MISPRELLLAFPLPALACVLLGALAARTKTGVPRRLVQAAAVALPFCLSFFAITGYVACVTPLGSATQLVPLLALPAALLAAVLGPREFLWRTIPVVVSVGFLACLFQRLGAPPDWPERGAATLTLAAVWVASRSGSTTQPAWRAPLALGTFAAAVALACICGRSAALALISGGLGACSGASFLVSLRRPSWSFGLPGLDVAVFALSGVLVCAVYLSELNPYAALVLLVSLVATRLEPFRLGTTVQLALTMLALWIAWPADGIAP